MSEPNEDRVIENSSLCGAPSASRQDELTEYVAVLGNECAGLPQTGSGADGRVQHNPTPTGAINRRAG